MSETNRETFASGIGTIFVLIGAAIGVGNVWRFPYMAGTYGGAVFVGLYVVFVFFLGIPAMMAELTLGRRTREGPARAYAVAGVPGGRFLGLCLVAAALMVTALYIVIIGQILVYFVDTVFVGAAALDPESYYSDRFDGVTVWNVVPAFFTISLVALTLNLGVRRGIEQVSRIATPVLFIALILVAIRSLTLPGALEGVRFFLYPDWSQLNGQSALAALGQAFFSLGLGGTFYLVYGSYFRSEQNIPATAVATSLGDLAGALIAGLAVLPAVFALGIAPASGPSLLFITLPTVFSKMTGGVLAGGLFFGSLYLANFLSGLSAVQVLLDGVMVYSGWSRGPVLTLLVVVVTLLALPSMASTTFLGWNDLISGSTMMPLGSAFAVVAVGWCLSRATALAEVNCNTKITVSALWILWLRYAIPPTILVVLLYGWWPHIRGLFA